MKPYSYLLIFFVLAVTWLSGCSSQKQLSTASGPIKTDTTTRVDIPHYIPQLRYSFQPYHFKPKQINISTKDRYEQAYNDLLAMLDGKAKPDFELAVFLSENPYHNGRFTYAAFQQSITEQVNVIRGIIAANDHSDTMNFDAHVNQYGSFNLADLRYLPKDKKELYRKALSNWAVFKYLTDTVTRIATKDKTLELYQHTPKMYASTDPFGMKDWRHSQVINLLIADSNTGNCFALTALFKILSDRLDAGSRICTAPQHIYIQHQDPNGHYYNVELATAGHPADGIIQTLTHTPSEAIMSGIALRDYTTKQSIGLCLVNLAKSYEHKFNTKDDGFMLRCADLALRYDSLNLNALLLKAQVLDAKVTSYATKNQISTIEQLKTDKSIAGAVIQLERHLARLARLGYRQMPVDMQEMIMNPLQYDTKKWDRKTRNPRPFTSIKVLDPKDEEYWTLTKGMFQEVFEPRDKETYGHFTVSNETGKLTAIDTNTLKGFIIDPVAFAYDFGARMYDARIGHFVSIDPLTSKYPSLSPYSFCNNNPIWFVEIDGRYFDYSNLTPEQRKNYDAHIAVLRQSELFDYVYKQLESSTSAFVVKVAPTSGTNPAEFRPNNDGHGGDIIYSPTAPRSDNAVLEENFHAYQFDNRDRFYSKGVSTSNIEFEAKIFNSMALNEAGLLNPLQGGTDGFIDFMNTTYDYNNPTSQQLRSPVFQNQYLNGIQDFVNYWRTTVPDPKTFAGYKKNPSADGPAALEKAQREVEAADLSGPRLPNGDYYAN